MFGFYSAKGARYGGSSYYETPSGSVVEVTYVIDLRLLGEENYKWDDKVCVGVVTKWVGKAREGSNAEKCK